MRTPCNPVNYRAGTGATCKQQEKNRLPVKGESYREPSSSIWTGGQKADPAAPEQAHNRRNNRRVQRLHERFWGARVRAMKNPARFYARASTHEFQLTLSCMNRVTCQDKFPDRQIFRSEFFAHLKFLDRAGSCSYMPKVAPDVLDCPCKGERARRACALGHDPSVSAPTPPKRARAAQVFRSCCGDRCRQNASRGSAASRAGRACAAFRTFDNRG